MVIAAGGFLLWQESNAPKSRELTLSIVGLESAKVIEVQISGADGVLVQRVERFLPDGKAPTELALTSPLQRGPYQIRGFASAPDGGTAKSAQTAIEVHQEEALSARLWFR